MCDVLIQYVRETLPEELATSLEPYIKALEDGDFQQVLEADEAKLLLGHSENDTTKEILLSDYANWSDYVFRRLGVILSHRASEPNQDAGQKSPIFLQHFYFILALAATYSFLQSTVTGPPLPFASHDIIFSASISSSATEVAKVRKSLLLSLGVDGEAAYKLTPNVELLCLSDTILICPPISKNIKPSSWAKLRVDFLIQRLLSDPAPSLQSAIYARLDALEQELVSQDANSAVASLQRDIRVSFLLERAAIHTHHGQDKMAREDLELATKERHFDFALTGRLGKRTKYQEKDTSQLVVLARSESSEKTLEDGTTPKETGNDVTKDSTLSQAKPENLDLNDDTLLEAISFTKRDDASTHIYDEDTLPPTLKNLDPEKQPLLDPLDSIILLSLASSIKNTSPEDGLTREETLPYATRVLDGGSSNWQVYTQALLVRSRIEGFKSRTMERGLLQLQVLVDQVIAETTTGAPSDQAGEKAATTFLPKAKESESAPIKERLRFVFKLASPSRWELEAELAQRWVTIGGLRSALDIFSRLEMWAEAALCWAATSREDKAALIVRRQLFHATSGADSAADLDSEKWEGPARNPPPADAPRLYCILGDINKDPAMYDEAWKVSRERYARAQRSLGRHYFSKEDYVNAAAAYSKSLKVNQINQQAWFALGCALLQLSEFQRAAEAFSRTVQLDDTDAEAWSNLAAALVHLAPEAETGGGNEAGSETKVQPLDDEEDDEGTAGTVRRRKDPQDYRRDALKALIRAARLKYDSYRIWENVLTVAASLHPPSWADVIAAQKRLIEIRGSKAGEKCIDVDVLEMLVRHVMSTEEEGYDASKPGLARMAVELVDRQVVPLITGERRLWQIVAKVQLWRRRPSSALEAHEKAWRVVTAQPKWEGGTEATWNEVVDATVDLVDAYKSLGGMERTEGLAAGSGEVVMKDWRFKARSAIRGVMGKGKEAWEGTEGWDRLTDALEDLKNS